MRLEEKHNSPSWTSLPEAAKVCKELVKCGCKEKHVGGYANACLFHFHAQGSATARQPVINKNVLDTFQYTCMYLNYSMSSNYSVQVSAKVNV